MLKKSDGIFVILLFLRFTINAVQYIFLRHKRQTKGITYDAAPTTTTNKKKDAKIECKFWFERYFETPILNVRKYSDD